MGFEPGVGAHRPDQLDAIHLRHVPVGHQQTEIVLPQHGQCRGAIVRERDVAKAHVVEQLPDDAPHALEVIDHENPGVEGNAHRLAVSCGPWHVRDRRKHTRSPRAP